VRPFVLFATGVLVFSSVAFGETIVVDSEVDAPASFIDGVPVCSALVGQQTRCTLRAAMQVANFNGGYTTIELQRGRTYVLSRSHSVDETPERSGPLTVGPIRFGAVVTTIEATGSAEAPPIITRSPDFGDSLFRITGNSAGGGILELHGLELLGDDSAQAPMQGSAISCDGGGELEASDTTFVGNLALSSGGAIALDHCAATFERSAFTGNRAGARGGAIASVDSSVVLRTASFDHNRIADVDGEGSAIDAQGISSDSAILAIDNTTYFANAGGASALNVSNITTVLRSATAIGNSSNTFLRVVGGALRMANTAVADNVGDVSIELSLGGALQSEGHNRLWRLIADASSSGTAQLTDSDALSFSGSLVSIIPAANWRGIVGIPQRTSPLIGQGGGEIRAVDGSLVPLCPEFDANLVSRREMERCDIGAANFVDDTIFAGTFELRALASSLLANPSDLSRRQKIH